LPAGSYMGGFRTPARALTRDLRWRASGNLHQVGRSVTSTPSQKADVRSVAPATGSSIWSPGPSLVCPPVGQVHTIAMGTCGSICAISMTVPLTDDAIGARITASSQRQSGMLTIARTPLAAAERRISRRPGAARAPCRAAREARPLLDLVFKDWTVLRCKSRPGRLGSAPFRRRCGSVLPNRRRSTLALS
jgi:hypothetical protein